MTVSCAEMKEIEKLADAHGISYRQMMENAGQGAARFIMDKIRPEDAPSGVLIFCGKGNNGGDGFVVARVLRDAGYMVDVILTDGMPQTEDALANFELVRDLITNRITEASVIVDAIYGTGFHGSFGDFMRMFAININGLKEIATVFALDIPSGLAGDGTSADEDSVCADYTLAFHDKKPVHDRSTAANYLGEVSVIDIGIREAVKDFRTSGHTGTIQEILLLGDPALYERSAPVEQTELEYIRSVAADLHETLMAYKKKYGAGRAIAAPQIGVRKRVLYLYLTEPAFDSCGHPADIALETPYVLINPVLEMPDGEQMEVLDDCMSFPGLYVRLRRYRTCILHYRDTDWNECSLTADGDISELLQHEYDHLDGILATMRAQDAKALIYRPME